LKDCQSPRRDLNIGPPEYEELSSEKHINREPKSEYVAVKAEIQASTNKQTKNIYTYRIRGSRSGDYEDFYLLRYNAV
jgi:hypothetical protein